MNILLHISAVAVQTVRESEKKALECARVSERVQVLLDRKYFSLGQLPFVKMRITEIVCERIPH